MEDPLITGVALRYNRSPIVQSMHQGREIGMKTPPSETVGMDMRSSAQEKQNDSRPPLLLLSKRQWTSNFRTSQLDTQNSFDAAQLRLVRCSGTVFEQLDFGIFHIGLGGEILLGHFRGDFVSPLGDGLADFSTDSLGLDNLV